MAVERDPWEVASAMDEADDQDEDEEDWDEEDRDEEDWDDDEDDAGVGEGGTVVTMTDGYGIWCPQISAQSRRASLSTVRLLKSDLGFGIAPAITAYKAT